ncbi:non-canonical purine NTP pyrophosphatase [Candidatus Woesearchaeota archaeon]|nr:non-canonical purine NTP pyrophosphatase [Candidatus Woesearchaeota archaeon]
MKVFLITSNENKIREFKLFLEPQIEVEAYQFEYPEIRSDDPCEITEVAAKQLAEKLKKPVIVEDSGFFIRALDEFPGTCTKYVFQRIGNEGLIKTMKGIKDRSCFYKSAIGYCEPGQKPVSFLGIEEGKVALKPAGKNGWGQDPIFIPKGKSKTYGQMRKKGDINFFRRRALEKLKRFLDKTVPCLLPVDEKKSN